MAAKPTHRIFQVEERGKDAKAFWREVGVGWANSDGSINMKFAVTPHFAEHTIQIRAADEQVDPEGGPFKPKSKK